ncbi:MAG: outer membrane beta-barrel protein [Pseudomonadota bacterium]|nr:outer membrane beta-barrel protein [Pseudomonadota bacterium]
MTKFKGYLHSAALILGYLGLTWISPVVAAAVHQPEEGDFFDAFATEQFASDDNLFRLPSGSQYLASLVGPGASRSDRINSVMAGLEGQWTFGRQGILFDAHAGNNSYHDNDRLNNTSGAADLMWDWRAGRLWTGQVGAVYGRALANFQNTFVYGRDLVDTIQYYGKAAGQFGPHWMLFGGAAERRASNSAETQKANDFRGNSGNIGVRYVASSETTLALNYEYATGDYPRESVVTFQGLPFNRTYRANTARFLASIPIGAKSVLEASVGYQKRDYPFSDVGSFKGDVWSALYTWQPSPKTRLVFNSSRQISAYLDAESLYFVSTGFSIAPTWQPTEKLTVSLQASSEKQNYTGPGAGVALFLSRRDHLSGEQAGLTYTPRNFLIFKFNYALQQRTSDIARFHYDDKLASASVTVKFL